MQTQNGTSLGAEAAEYLRVKRKRLTPSSARGYTAALAELARYFPGHQVEAFEPPAGTALIEDFLTATWGARAARTYNKNLSIVRDFFLWQLSRGRLNRDPTLSLERARPRAIHRTTFDDAQRAAIVAASPDLRDSLALRLLLDYGIRKGALQRIQLQHFDRARQRLVIFTKGEKVLQIPLPDERVWADLARLLAEGALPSEYLLPWQRVTHRRLAPKPARIAARIEQLLAEATAAGAELADELADVETARLVAALDGAQAVLEQARRPRTVTRRDPGKQIGEHGLHDWWYRCLRLAGLVAEGIHHGERMHKARHTAGQRVLDKTGNLKAVQALLGHSSIRTTADSYLDWEIDQLAETLREVVAQLPSSSPAGTAGLVERPSRKNELLERREIPLR